MRRVVGGAAVLVAAFLFTHGPARAADVKFLSPVAIKPAMDVLGPQFERSTKNKLLISYLQIPEVLKVIEGGEAFDVAISNPANIDPLIKSGKIVASSRVQVARFGLGIGVRSGAQRPDISSTEGFRQTLLNAKSVAYVGAGAGGAAFLGIVERLGITNQMKDKLRPGSAAENISVVAKGEVDLLAMSVPTIVASSGVELAGAFPDEYQDHIVLEAGIATAAPQASAGAALIKYLLSSEAVAVFKAKGLRIAE